MKKRISVLMLAVCFTCSGCQNMLLYRDGRKGIDAHEIAVNVLYVVAIGQTLSLAADSLNR